MTATVVTDLLSPPVQYYFTCTVGGGNDSGWQPGTSYTDTGLTPDTLYTYTVKARDAVPNETAQSTGYSATTSSDTDPPTAPTFAVSPAAVNETSISMTATASTDLLSPPVQYYFTCTVGGGNDSGWQPGTSYTDTGLTPDTLYTYTVKARDSATVPNETAQSTGASATTDADTDPPTAPTFAIVPAAVDETSISMTSTVSTDLLSPPVQYYFTCAAGGGNDSGWQPGTSYTDTGLTPNTLYTYTVKARDNATPTRNETGESASASATTTVDGTPPAAPDFATVPTALDQTQITMISTVVTDALSGPVEYYFTETSGNTGGTDSNWQAGTSYTDTGLNPDTQYTYTVKARDAATPTRNETGESASASATTTVDGTPPAAPDFATVPTAIDQTQITMISTVVTDALSGPVEYYFTETSGNTGGTDSSWQAGTSYTDTGLNPDTQYTYTVKARDNATPTRNETSESTSASATTDADITPPTAPTFAIVPAAIDQTSISMTASVVTDALSPPVQYYFTCTAGGGNDSGWQPGTSYTDTGLTPNTLYTYTVKARDAATIPNETAESPISPATTDVDSTPPTAPTFAIAPAAIDETSISMTASVVTDALSPPVQYYFTCTVGGGNDSGWQAGTSYTDIGISPNTQYTYTVKARDNATIPNETAESSGIAATTDADTTPPTAPTFAISPTAISETSITMTATVVTDALSPPVQYYFTCTFGGGSDSGWQPGTSYTDTGLNPDTQYAYTVKARDNATPTRNETSESTSASATTDADITPPTAPTFAIVPAAVDQTSISMTSTVVTDLLSPPIQYYFTCAAGGGNDSGWQPGTSYTDTGLTPNTLYTYTVKARDAATVPNETAESPISPATTDFDVTPPTAPTFAVAPTAVDETSISMTATVSTDALSPPVQYYFTCTVGGGNDSGWQAGTSYTDIGLSPNTQYTYTVKARDNATIPNETVESGGIAATTDADTTPPTAPIFAISPTAISETSITMTASVVTDALSPPVQYYFTCTVGGGNDSGWQPGTTYTDTGLTPDTPYTYTVKARDFATVPNETAESAGSSVTTDADITPPTAPAFAIAPVAVDQTSISMTATVVTDALSPPVQYYFTCMAGGGNDSGWQPGTSYTDTALAPDTAYTYTVKARDAATIPNETAESIGASATTSSDITPPTAPAFAIVPAAVDETSISMTSTVSTDLLSNPVQYYFTCTVGGGNDSGWQPGTSYTDTGLSPNTQYTYTVKARDAASIPNETAESGQLAATTDADITPPTAPTFAIAPAAASETSITMTATVSTDALSPPVQYYFTCTVGGGNDSGWQPGTSYTDTGLIPDTSYTYTVKARDNATIPNETVESTDVSETTDPDISAPTPDPATFASAPVAISDSSITMTANIGSDLTGPVEYYFANSTDPTHFSGWQTDPNYTDTGLNPNTSYTYTVRMRDALANQTGTTSDSATTMADSTPPTPDPATFSTKPFATSETAIRMFATSGTDVNGPVMYYFTCTVGGGNDSGWQPSDVYTDNGLLPNTSYTYTVKTKDTIGNETTESGAETATTFTDSTPPTPNPATFAIPPAADSETEISMTADVGNDLSGPIEYLFTCTVGGGPSSGWQVSDPTYTATGLTPSTSYTYSVQMKDAIGNLTGTNALSATTLDDVYPPLPNPAGFLQYPTADSETEISMEANPGTDISGPVKYFFACTAGGGNSSNWQTTTTYTDTGLTPNTEYTYTVQMRDSAGNYTGTEQASATTWADNTAPNPDPATFATAPTAISETAISMTATTGSDALSEPVEYYFANTTDPAHDSGWQFFSIHIDTGLTPNTTYTYTIQMKDKVGNLTTITVPDSTRSATTDPDIDPPTPDPATFDIGNPPIALNETAISLTATTGSDALSEPVEYYFENVTDPTHDSGWQPGTTYTDTVLDPNTEYTYTIQMKDAVGNLTTITALSTVSISTLADTTPPTPNPAYFAVLPAADSEIEISMTAFIGSDTLSEPVKYLFTETTGNPGGTSSGWQLSENYTDSGLDPNTLYTYRVQVKDSVGNLTGTTTESATTDPDLTPPTPNPPTFASPPTEVSDSSISMTADTGIEALSTPVEYYFANVTDPAHDSGWQTDPSYTDTGLTQNTSYTYSVQMRDAAGNLTGITTALPATTSSDITPPDPNPATFASDPSADNETEISMMATIGSDLAGPIEYLFSETSGNPGGTSSGWQVSDPTYTDTVLDPNTQYTYSVQMRDSLGNLTGTTSASATTDPDITAPTPDQATFATPPTADSEIAISMTATTGTDISGPIEYLFTETTGNPGGTSSGWQTSPNYTDSGLIQNTQYTYTVQMRDNAQDRNYTAASNPASVFTDPDITPPDPDPATFDVPPTADSDSAISMRATTGTDVSGPVEYYFANDTDPAHDSGWQTDANFIDTGLTPSTEYTYTIQMKDAVGNLTTITALSTASVFTLADTSPPEPDPATFALAPSPDSATAISMTATIGSDLSGPIDYYFANTTDPAHDSGWQRSSSHTDTGLDPATEYIYTVQMRDSVLPTPNVGTASDPASAITLSDLDPPTPDPATFSSPPAKVSGQYSDSRITMTASIGTDTLSGPVEYYFTEISGNPGATDSGWQLSRDYTDTGLKSNTQFTYTVKMRDAIGNESTLESVQASATTDGDKTPPTPNPATFSSPPAAIDDSAIIMTATTGNDFSGPVMYLFTETSGNPGGTSSGWQTNSTYTDNNLYPSVTYSYTVQTRDSSVPTRHTGTASLVAYATTDADSSGPEPNPATFSLSPIAISDVAVTMRATVGTDFNGPVEYLFTETTDGPGATDGTWQTEPNYTDTGLTPDTQYTYTVQMRDGLGNTGTASTPVDVTTDTASKFYVDAASPNNPGGGTFTNPYRTIKDAINDPNCVDGCEIILFPGTYTGSRNRNIDFVGKAITIRGTSVYDWDVVASTVIDCEQLGRAFVFQLDEGPDSVIEGLTITNGYVDLDMQVRSPGAGGAIEIFSYSIDVPVMPTISNCIFYGNSAMGDEYDFSFGGAIDSQYASPLIYDCIFYDNYAEIGGAIASFGDDSSAPIIAYCTITANVADYFGGGMSFEGDEFLAAGGQALNCRISGNYADIHGGGIYTYAAIPEIKNCMITGNSSGEYGGGIKCTDASTPSIINCTISDNVAALGGGGIATNVPIWDPILLQYSDPEESEPIIQNCVFTGNSNYAIYEGSDDGNPQLMINCFFDNPDGDYWNSISATVGDGEARNGAVSINNIDLVPAGGNIRLNIDGDPLFIMDAITDPRNIGGNWTTSPTYDAISNRTTLVNASALFEPGELVGEYIASGQNDPNHFRVMDNTATSIEVIGDQTTGIVSGDAYQMIDYRFKTGTPCLDAGEPLGAPSIDFTGGGRFAKPDIGALEYSEIINITANTVFSTIQDAIDNSINGDIVEVYDGYYPRTAGRNTAIDLNGKDITLRSTMGPDLTIIDAWGDPVKASVVTFDGSETADCVVEGFTLMGGYFGTPSQLEPTAGIYGGGSSASIRNCIITENRDGTTISYLHGDILNSHIFDNTSLNVADRKILYECDGRVAYNLFADNITGANWGLIAYCSGLIENNIIANNVAMAGIFDYNDAVVRYNTIYRNTNTRATFSGDDGVYISNIDWNNAVSGADLGLDVTYTISNVAIPGVGNIMADPMLADPDNGDYTLLPGSPCLDVADPSNHPSDDFVGNPRPADTTNPQTHLLMPGNINLDYHVDFDDIIVMLDNWLRTDCPCDGADVYPPGAGDGVINLLDFSVLAEYWLTEDTTFDIGAYELQSNNLRLNMDIWSEQFIPANRVNIEQQKCLSNFTKFMGSLV